MYEVQKYVSILNWAWNGNAIFANADAWRKLPKNIQDIVAKNIDASGLSQRQDMVRLETTLEQGLIAKGMVSAHPDIAPFKSVIRSSGLYSQWRTQYGADGFALLEKSVGTLS
jgi:TRAP-type C4-dicarboxylate transport system substrate-binding protein